VEVTDRFKVEPWQIGVFEEIVLIDKTGGWEMVTVAVALHMLASVTVTIYEPAFNPVAVENVCMGKEFHE
jgi:hypothetical protein